MPAKVLWAEAMKTFDKKLPEPTDCHPFTVGSRLVFVEHHPWHVRAWRWFKRVILRRKPPVFVVASIESSDTLTFDTQADLPKAKVKR